MHECGGCGMYCDCDGEDHDQPQPIDCICACSDLADGDDEHDVYCCCAECVHDRTLFGASPEGVSTQTGQYDAPAPESTGPLGSSASNIVSPLGERVHDSERVKGKQYEVGNLNPETQ